MLTFQPHLPHIIMNSRRPLHDLSHLKIMYTQYTLTKVGIKSCRHAGGCVSFVYGYSYPAAIVFDQTHVISIGKTGW